MVKRARGPNPRLIIGTLTMAGLAVIGAISASVTGCGDWTPAEPFERNAPDVDEAIRLMDAGQYKSAEEVLEAYLGTGQCSDAGIGLPDRVRQRPNGSFDLGLTLFGLAEEFGQRFGEEDVEPEEDEPVDEEAQAARNLQIDCALIVVKAIAADENVPIELRARAYYLAGNLEFMRRRYRESVLLYDQALRLVPGVLEEAGGDEIGRDTAWNRAIALRRIEEEENENDAGPDGEDGEDGDDGEDAADAEDSSDGDDGSDGDPDQPDGGEDGGDPQPDGGDDGGDDEDGGDPQNDQGDAGDDGGSEEPDQEEPEPQPQSPDPDAEEEAPSDPSTEQDDRVLDEFEQAPSYQEEEARKNAAMRRGRRRTMEDK